VAEIHEDLVKAKKESLKDRIPPRAPRDKPTVMESKDDTLMYAAHLTALALYYDVMRSLSGVFRHSVAGPYSKFLPPVAFSQL